MLVRQLLVPGAARALLGSANVLAMAYHNAAVRGWPWLALSCLDGLCCGTDLRRGRIACPNSLLQLPRCLYASLRLLSCTFCLNTNAG